MKSKGANIQRGPSQISTDLERNLSDENIDSCIQVGAEIYTSQFCRSSCLRRTHSDNDCSVTVQSVAESSLPRAPASLTWNVPVQTDSEMLPKDPCLLGFTPCGSPPLSVGGTWDLLLTNRI